MADKKLELGVQEVTVSLIRESKKALREAQRDTEAYIELVDSIRNHGVMNPICLRRQKDEDDKEFFELVDGVQRFNAAMDCGMETIVANVIADASEADMLRKQIVGNIHRIETRPVEYSKHLQQILALDPLLTVSTLASQLNKSPAWISQRLGLLQLDAKIAELVDEGKINLSNAYALAKLPADEQINYAESAMTKTPGEFIQEATARKKELDKARREGRSADKIGFIPVARYQKLADAKAEIEEANAGALLCRQEGCKTPEEGFLLGVKWCVKLDPVNVAEGQAAWDQKQEVLKERRESAKKDRMDKRAKDAEVKAARIKIEAEAVRSGKTEEEVTSILEDFDKAEAAKEK